MRLSKGAITPGHRLIGFMNRIQYIGRSWTTVEDCEQCAAGLDISQAEGGTFHMVNQADNKAVFNFTGNYLV